MTLEQKLFMIFLLFGLGGIAIGASAEIANPATTSMCMVTAVILLIVATVHICTVSYTDKKDMFAGVPSLPPMDKLNQLIQLADTIQTKSDNHGKIRRPSISLCQEYCPRCGILHNYVRDVTTDKENLFYQHHCDTCYGDR